MNITIVLNLLTSFLLAYVAIPSIVQISHAKHLFDVPDHRKLNKVVVPTLGGVGIFLGLVLSSLIFMQGDAGFGFRYLFAALIMMFFIGIKDDILILSAKKKLMVQILAALILVVLGNYKISNFYGLAGLIQVSDWISIPVSVLFILFIMNAVNLIDGIDGLAAGISLMLSFCFGIWFYFTGHADYGTACFALSGSLLAFLRFNLWGGDNKVFMGDTGSLILGTFLATIAIKFNELNYVTYNEFYINYAPLFILGLFIVPITDTLRVFTIRIKNKRSPFAPDMNHLHHLLIKSGLTHIQASGFFIAYTVMFTLMALTVQKYTNITIGFSLLLGLSFACVGGIYFRMKRIEERIAIEEASSTSRTIKINFWGNLKEEPSTIKARKSGTNR
ncbi:glycosyltransferase family 4 protein [Mangrovibacterium lignilyticum]|uniref:glycosyltransferase family 4 protein n=1 Tax=Mangrovibacterium lignilyticum TaxID=2668052 RepID=UPI0013D83409|nr:MraY family glycosyltransferase [Mangrovibacterium lignilyticum]